MVYSHRMFCKLPVEKQHELLDPYFCPPNKTIMELFNGELKGVFVSYQALRFSVKSLYGLEGYKRISAECRKRSIELSRDSLESKSGVRYPAQARDFHKKVRETNKKRYGVENQFQRPEVKEKILSVFRDKDYQARRMESINRTMIERYGCTLGSKGMNERSSKAKIENRFLRISSQWEKVGVRLLEEYKGLYDESHSYVHYKFLCTKCGNEFESIAVDVPLCPVCYPRRSFRSFGERRLEELLKSEGLTVEVSNRDLISKSSRRHFEIDLLINDIGIEYNGFYWHSCGHNISIFGEARERSKFYHQEKTEVALEHGIRLYHVWQSDNLDIVESKLKSLFGKSANKVFARKCEVVDVAQSELSRFFKENHLHGNVGSLFGLGLKYNGDLVACISFRNHAEGVEIARFASKLNFSVPGAFSRLLHHALPLLRDKGFKQVVTYADRDWSPDPYQTVYYKSGFTFVEDVGPILRYTDFKKVVDRRAVWKGSPFWSDKEYDSELTMDQNLELNGWFPIYNSGNLKYKLSI